MSMMKQLLDYGQSSKFENKSYLRMKHHNYYSSAIEKQLLQSRYKELEFLDEVTDVQCGRCQRVALHHYYTNCGHLFCDNCQRMLSCGDKDTWKCPVCQQHFTSIHEQRLSTENRVNSLNVYCLNKKYGCNIITSVLQLPQHLKSCENTKESVLPALYRGENADSSDSIFRQLQNVINKNDQLQEEVARMREIITNNKKISDDQLKAADAIIEDLKKQMSKMKSEVQVNFAQIQNEISTIKSKQDDVQSQNSNLSEIANLSNGISKNNAEIQNLLYRENLLSKTCADQEQKLKDIHCEFDVKLQNCIEETKKQENTTLTKLEKVKIETKLTSLEKEILFKMENKGLNIVPELEKLDTLVYTWKVTNASKMDCKKESEVFPLKGYHFGAQVVLQNLDNRLYISFCFVDLQNSEQALNLTIIPEVTYILKDVRRNREIKDIIRCDDFFYPASAVDYNRSMFMRGFGPTSLLTNSIYNRDDSIQVEIYVEPPSVAHQVSSTDGVIFHKIENYQKKLKMEKQDLMIYQASPYFYTSPNGYRVRVKMFLDGFLTNKSNGLTAEVVFLAGELDLHLPQSFTYKVTFTIFHPTDSNLNLYQNFTAVSKQRHSYFDIASHTDIDKKGFTKNDALIYKAAIEII